MTEFTGFAEGLWEPPRKLCSALLGKQELFFPDQYRKRTWRPREMMMVTNHFGTLGTLICRVSIVARNNHEIRGRHAAAMRSRFSTRRYAMYGAHGVDSHGTECIVPPHYGVRHEERRTSSKYRCAGCKPIQSSSELSTHHKIRHALIALLLSSMDRLRRGFTQIYSSAMETNASASK